MNLNNKIAFLKNRIRYSGIIPKYTLSNFKVFNELYRKTPEYTDSTYYPFYFHLGKVINPKNLLEIGFETGLQISCFLQSCFDVENILLLHNKKDDNWHYRIPCSNIANITKKIPKWWDGRVDDNGFLKYFLLRKWDATFLTQLPKDKDYIKKCLQSVWQQTNVDGIIIIENVKNKTILDSYNNFCESINRPSIILPTRNGVGIAVK